MAVFAYRTIGLHGIRIFLVLGLATVIGQAQTISESRHLLVKAETLEELNFKPESMLSIFKILMRGILTEDPEIASQLVLKTHQLIEKNRQANQDGYFNDTRPGDNRTHIASFLTYFERDSQSLEAIGVQVRTYRDDDAGIIQYSGNPTTTRKYAFLSHFLSCGGNYDAALALDAMLIDLRNVCGEGNSIFLAPDFLDLCYSLRQHQRDQLVDWAYRNSSHSDITLASIADAALLGASIYERAERVPFNSKHIIKQTELDGELLELIQNKSISPSWRIGFACILAKRLPDELSTRVRIEVGNIINLLSGQNQPIENHTLIHATSIFLGELSNSKPWQEVGKKLIKTLDEITQSKTGKLYKFSIWERHRTAQLMALNCRTGTDAQILAQFQRFDHEPSFYPNLWIELIRNKQFKLANELFKLHAANLPYQVQRFQLNNTFDDRLAAQIEGYLATIENEPDRFFASLLLAATPNNNHRFPSLTDQSRLDRLNAAVNSYANKGTFDELDKTKRFRVLELLTNCQQNPTATKWLEADQKSLVGRLQQREPKGNNYWGARMEMHSAIEQLNEGKHFPALFFWGRIAVDRNKTIDSRRRYISEAFLHLINENIKSAIEQNDTDRLNAILPFCRQVLNTYPDIRPIHISSETLQQFVVHNIIAHVYSDQAHHWNQFWNDLPLLRKQNLAQLLHQYPTLVPELKTMLNPHDLAPGKWQPDVSTRRRFFTQLLQTNWVDDGCRDNSTLAELSALGLLTAGDVSTIADKIAREAPRQGNAWREYAGVLADAGRLDEALRELDDQLAMDHAPESLRFVLKLEKFLLLKVMGNVAAANQFKLKQLLDQPPELPREYGAVLRELERR